MIVVEGNYRNEVTGQSSESSIRLRALTDMRKRSDANINLLTTLEFDRVYHLVTRGDSAGKKLTVKHAKRQAQREILKQFQIELGDNTDAEDMKVFGSSEADAALLAISVLLQGDGNETDLSVLLTEISNAIADKGEWNDSAARMKLVEWALAADNANRLAGFRKNVMDWRLSDTVPEFEKIIRKFVNVESRLGMCGSDSVRIGTVKYMPNPYASKYYASSYEDISKSRTRFTCDERDGVRIWRFAYDIEKDTLGFGVDYEKGDVKTGVVDKDLAYVFEGERWRHGTNLDLVVGEGCIAMRKNLVMKGSDNVWYKCVGDTTVQYRRTPSDSLINATLESSWKSAWRVATQIEKDTNGLGSDGRADGDTASGRVDEDNLYVFEDGFWVDVNADATVSATMRLMGIGCVRKLNGMVAKGSDGVWRQCRFDSTMVFDVAQMRYSYTRWWLPATGLAVDTMWAEVPAGGWEKGTVRNGLVNSNQTYVYQGGWRIGTALDSILVKNGGTACLDEGDTSSVKHDDAYYVCTHQTWGDTIRKWVVAPDIYNKTFELRDSCAAGKMYDGMAITSIPDAWGAHYYVCDAGKFKEVQVGELKPGYDSKYRACVSYNKDHIYRSQGYFYKCTEDGWILAAVRDTGVVWDGQQEYKTVIIGTQHWMAENLNHKTTNSYCYNGLSSNCSTYGRLYTWEDAQSACPAGWHLPTKSEWETLVSAADGEEEGGYKLKSKEGWYNDGNGWDHLSFTALPAGYWNGNNGKSDNLEKIAYFWSSTKHALDKMAYHLKLEYNSKKAIIDYNGEVNAFSVRCLQDSN